MWDRIYQGQDNLSNQRLDCTTFTCTSLLWLSYLVHIVTRKPQPSLAKSTLVCVLSVSDWPQILETADYMWCYFSDLTPWIYTSVVVSCSWKQTWRRLQLHLDTEHPNLSQFTVVSKLKWSELLIQIVLPKLPRKFLEFTVRDLVDMKAMKVIPWQLQADWEEDLTAFDHMWLNFFFKNSRREESSCDFLWSCLLLYLFFHVCRYCLEILTAWQTKHFFNYSFSSSRLLLGGFAWN